MLRKSKNISTWKQNVKDLFFIWDYASLFLPIPSKNNQRYGKANK